jgi:hypothetical protein
VTDHEVHQALAADREVAGEHLVEHHAGGVDVAPVGRARGSLALLGSHVDRSAQQCAGLRAQLPAVEHPFGELRDSEVEQLGALAPLGRRVRHQHEVLRLEVAVHDASRVGRHQGIAHLPDDAQGQRGGQTSAGPLQALAQRLAAQELHDDVGCAAVELPELEDLHDTRVVDHAGGAPLVEEASHELGVRGQVRS